MERVLLLSAIAALSMRAGAIQGVVLEHASGRPLSRAIVRLEPVAKPGSPTPKGLTLRSGRSGYFVFPAVASGLYLVVAERDGYFPGAYGQRLPAGLGTPVTVTPDSSLFAEIRLRHKGAITGRVLDENGVGRPGTTVFAYRAQLPLRSAGSAVSDDRGVYRIHGLAPGKYWVRSAAQTLDDGSGWLPTYGPQVREARDSRIHRVVVDADTTDADVSPDPGALFRVGGIITCDRDGMVTVVLSSETGRRQAQTSCKGSYMFDSIAPGNYEIFAKTQEGPPAAGFIEMFIGGDTLAANVQVLETPAVDFEIRRAGTNSAADIPLILQARRQDLAVTESSREIRAGRVALDPGHWEFRAQVPEGYYVDSITNVFSYVRRPRRDAVVRDWYEVFIEARSPARIRLSVSDQPGEISGVVRAESQPVPGVMVFLWPVEEAARRSIGGSRQLLTDTEGRFRFPSLPPGDYRVLATFDVNEIDEELLELTRARTARATASQITSIELGVWQAP